MYFLNCTTVRFSYGVTQPQCKCATDSYIANCQLLSVDQMLKY